VNRTVGFALRRTAGGGVLIALGFGALSTGPQTAVPVVAATASVTGPVIVLDERLPHRAVKPVVFVYEKAKPAATLSPPVRAARATSKPVPGTLVRKPAASHAPGPAPARVIGAVTGAANGFAYGYCTWWVAHKRYVPWRGNAAQWWWNARPFGYHEGSTPRPGAIMVMGYSSTSPEGHVGYVESVNANGSFVVSEMNWWGVPGGGWGRVDYRTVTSMRGILGFIY
jgi:surface antigen